MKTTKNDKKIQRKNRIKSVIKATNDGKPRLVIFRSLNYNYAQIVDDVKHVTVASSSDMKLKKGTKLEKAKEVGLELAKLAKEKKVTKVVFDRNGYRYMGRIKAIADGAREGGLQF